jgi:type IV secretion system protein VirD4
MAARSATVARLALAAAAALVLCGSLAIATQHAAADLRYARALGRPLATVGSWRLYAPWAWLQWSARFGEVAPRVFAVAQAITFAGGLGAFALLLVAARIGRQVSGSTTHGSARWASDGDLAKSGLLEPNGVVLCQTAEARYSSKAEPSGTRWVMKRPGRLVRHDGPEHVFVFAPTRSGKGIGIVIPTLLSWNRSVIVYDIKKELWAATAGWRRRFSHCWRFEPTATDSVRFNPLLEIRRGLSEVKDAQNVADILVDPQGSSERRDHWQQTAHTLLVGAILHVLYAEPDKSLAGVAAFLADPARTQEVILGCMLTARHTPDGPHPVVAQTAREMLNKSENELSGVFSTAMTCLALYADPVIAANTSASDFRIADLMDLDSPVSLYLVVPPSDIDRTRPLIRLMLNQIGRRLTERLEFHGTAYKHRLLLLLDEFPSLGRLAFFEAELPYLAGYGIKCFLIAQSLNQIEKAYGANNAILDNCHVRVTYNALDERTARRISDLLGQGTLTRRQRSYSGAYSWLSKVSHSEQEVGRALLMPDEILRLPFDEALLMVGGLPPYHAKKIMYYLDERFRGRAWQKTPESARSRRAELPRGPAVGDEWPRRSAPAHESSQRAPLAAAPPDAAAAPTPPPEMNEAEARLNRELIGLMATEQNVEPGDPAKEGAPTSASASADREAAGRESDGPALRGAL